MQRLLLTPRFPHWIAVESQILQTGLALDQLELTVLEMIDIAEHRVQVIERGA